MFQATPIQTRSKINSSQRGLKQHVDGPTHPSGHTLDLIIDHQEDKVLSSFSTLRDLPSDHYAVLCSVAFAQPAATKSQYKTMTPQRYGLGSTQGTHIDLTSVKKAEFFRYQQTCQSGDICLTNMHRK